MSAWPRTNSVKENTDLKHGGGPLNDLYKIVDGINLGLTKPTRIPSITTLFKFAHRCLRVGDGLDNSHGSVLGMTGSDLTADQFVDIPVLTRTQSTETRDSIVFEQQAQTLKKKTLPISGTDPNTLSDSTANATHLAAFNASGQLIKTHLDTRIHTILRLARVGRYHCASVRGVDAEGVLQGLVGVGDQGTTTLNTGGKYHVWNPKAVVNDCAGVVKLDGFTTWRLTNPLIRFAFLFITGAGRRMFKGWTGQRLLSVDSDTAPLLPTESGFIFGYGSTDTQFQIFHNDGAGLACVKTSTGINLPAVGTNYILEISISGASFTWSLYGVDGVTQARGTQVGTGTISTRTPPLTTTALCLQDLISISNTSISANNIHYIEVFD